MTRNVAVDVKKRKSRRGPTSAYEFRVGKEGLTALLSGAGYGRQIGDAGAFHGVNLKLARRARRPILLTLNFDSEPLTSPFIRLQFDYGNYKAPTSSLRFYF